MALGSYDSPTFLGSKDKYLIGLSLPQLMLLIGAAFMAFIFTLLLPFGFMMRMLVVAPFTGVLGIFLFARISGLSIPAYLFHAVSYMFHRPVYEEHEVLLLNGAPVWLEAQRHQQGRSGLFRKLRGSSRAVSGSLEMENRANELRAEFDGKMVESSVAAEQMVRDGFRTLMRS